MLYCKERLVVLLLFVACMMNYLIVYLNVPNRTLIFRRANGNFKHEGQCTGLQLCQLAASTNLPSVSTILCLYPLGRVNLYTLTYSCHSVFGHFTWLLRFYQIKVSQSTHFRVYSLVTKVLNWVENKLR